MTHSNIQRPHSYIPLIQQFTPLPKTGSVYQMAVSKLSAKNSSTQLNIFDTKWFLEQILTQWMLVLFLKKSLLRD